jgi:hypothetical protein
VAGAAVGIALAEVVRVADGRALALGVADGAALGVVVVTLGPGEVLDDAELATPGDNFGGVGCDDPVQATTDAEASTAAKLTAVSLT